MQEPTPSSQPPSIDSHNGSARDVPLQIPEANDSILKPKPERKRPNFSPEYRAALADRMRKVNQDRIANSAKTQNAKLIEERKIAREAKKAELEAEIEKLKAAALAEGARLAPVTKVRKPREPKLPDDKEFDSLISKAKEANQARGRKVAPEPESEDSDPEPPKRVKKPAARTAPPAPAPQPVLRCKFV